jgi:NAD+ synthase (glutamine-hydrolysing)
MRLVKIGLVSVNTTVGAFRSNVVAALTAGRELAARETTVAIFQEQLIGGYPQEDLVQWHDFVDQQWTSLLHFAHQSRDLATVFVLGVTVAERQLRYNCAAVVHRGQILGLVPKEKLPTYNIFYEGRTFARGFAGMNEKHRGIPLGDFIFEFDFGVLGTEICEDLWSADGPMKRRAYAGAELIVNLSASPFRIGVEGTRREMISTRAGDHQCTLAYVNQVGAQDGLIFDGGGYVNQNGRMAIELKRFAPGFETAVVDLNRTARLRTENTTWRDDLRAYAGPVPATIRVESTTVRTGLKFPVPPNRSFFLPLEEPQLNAREKFCEDLLEALSLGIAGYFQKTRGFSRIGIALSGGRDSLLTLLIAHRFAAKAKVPIETFYMPTRFSSKATEEAAATIAAELGVSFQVLSIDEAFEREMEATKAMLGPGVELTPVTMQNVQARLRAQRMWNWANTSGGLFLQTGNMSEKAVGYTTIGGDLMGALAVIANLPKTVVMYLLDYVFEKHQYQGIKLATARPAGPELAPNQVGEDELMPFQILDACFHLFAGEKMSVSDVTAALEQLFPEVLPEIAAAHVKKFVRLFNQSIYKWVQSPISLHVGNLDLDRERALQLPVVTQTEWF